MGALLATHEFRGVGVSWPLTFLVRAQDPSLRVEISAEVIAMPTMPPTPNAAADCADCHCVYPCTENFGDCRRSDSLFGV